ncbi:DUF397 domain-containing protein [Nocardiopsis sp. MT53]|uniref:DUF397 domain-containing protein n=1 Tax=Nocardiopsis changdeensis TaxID=2831969 RepID=A0ABX8BMV6_9ACTN|nr:DUF397 domain-containing protein [Nocardiopsis flavescens]QUX23035.1 DUF397 domain-containing protein [Nocardiopsis changdeensis]QYX38980.1 DUF397 domain-containing protein [Nocardiopsis sp. MT53]
MKSRHESGRPLWHKSSYSSGQGSCVEVAEGQSVLVRDTQNRPLGHLDYSAEAWASFLQGVKLHA